ncbi:DUF1800 domain-containing protein [Pseudoponticoccus marisrubri]|uniref:DUF1800 domain-containing protein n=1 Tax=Pseudoponticoccus marisrubri TaxID=1685382 RepID=A0A0W7WHT7_9RHOB|nr:DUF1800 domain-containing protein [Pseudoponticoccus marisrubri]KUF10203.1 hypothetical protein AVJ23_14270 [Pseudoponticoccus marisrubri]
MRFDPILAETRFGCGLSPLVAPPADGAALLAGLEAPDVMAARFPIERFATFLSRMRTRRDWQKILRDNRGSAMGEAARKEIRLLNKAARQDNLQWLAAHVLRRVYSPTPFRERLEGFWADHFTATGKAGLIRRATSPYIEEAIRPNLSGRFEDLLIAAVTHPLMVHYLDQQRSAGPGSARAQRRPGVFGLNENLAREILELHTLGVDGPYTQADVRQLAELMSGLTLHFNVGRQFRKDMAEPGAETVLGVSYGGGTPHLRDIEAVLRDLARHPATARHVARKLATHFVSDRPEPSLVAALEQAYRDSGGELRAVYAALLAHPAAWDRARPNVKQPFHFIASACRALVVPPEALLGQSERALRLRLADPLRLMGHVWQKPDGPDGLAEADSAWITPQGMAARLQWAVAMPRILLPDLPDPRDFVTTALGPDVPEAVRFAARAAESRADGIGMVLISPAFQRM